MTFLDTVYEQTVEKPEFKINFINAVITDNVAAVEVELWLNPYEYFTAKGESKRDPKDAANPEVAIKLAVGRAVRQLGRDILAEGQTLVREADVAARKQADAAEKALKAKRERVAQAKKYHTYTSV